MPPPFVMHVKYHTGWIPIVTKSIKPKLEEKKKEEQKKGLRTIWMGMLLILD